MFDAEKFAAFPIFPILSSMPCFSPCLTEGFFIPYYCLLIAPLSTMNQSNVNCTCLVKFAFCSYDGCIVKMFDGLQLRNLYFTFECNVRSIITSAVVYGIALYIHFGDATSLIHV